ncbi:MAG: GMC family oxidoreductase [Steroidobacteraceae bacterium]
MNDFDYIIVGAGTAGCVVATRLSASRKNNVLLLEAGGSDRRFWIRVPVGYGRTFGDPRVNWMYRSEPDPALAGRRGYWPRGKVLGGSGSINGMVYVRGFPCDFDGWQALGNPGWGYRDVLPFFKMAEDYCDTADSAYVGHGGPIHVSDMSHDAHPLCRTFIESCEALGYAYTEDFNGADAEGVGIYKITTRDGIRESTAQCHLRPALGRSNLSLRLHTHALRVLFDGTRAVGVAYRHGNRTLEARAGKAVILCLGTVNTPQLLQLSGIGDGALLRRHGIAVVADNPAVGRNLQDHLDLTFCFRSKVPTLNDELYPLTGKVKAGLRYLLTRGGQLAISINQAGGFVRSDARQPIPNLQLYFSPLSYNAEQWPIRRLMNPDPFSAFMLSFNPCRPTSRGRVEIRSANPFDAPLIYTDYLTTEHDLREAVAGMHLLRTIAATAPLSSVIEAEMLPGLAQQSDAELLQDLRERATTVFHPTSTCLMGPDPGASVVDARLRVHGVPGLRIVDASIFPAVTSGNINAPTIMVAEKGAAMIAEDEGG